ncbi:MAG: LuxR C-terminal-related transcriptional regulator [Coxiellaceae bacterium]|nr:LuxR C-terminal-related transcriptional regulator [Coxiellaceae bacterium]
MKIYLTTQHPREAVEWSTLSALPYNVYLLDTENKTILINITGAHICGFETVNAAIGNTISSVSNAQSASSLLANCNQVMLDQKEQIFDEHHTRHDGQDLHFLSFKFPCFQADGQLIGILGISLVVGQHPLSDALETLKNLGLLHSNKQPTFNLHGLHLTEREHAILQQTAQGLSAKSIAKYLEISHRTVEEHIKNIKLKFNVSSKQALLHKVRN